jgi:hypothetical protein
MNHSNSITRYTKPKNIIGTASLHIFYITVYVPQFKAFLASYLEINA